MRILIGGDEQITSDYMEWLQESLSADISTCKEHDSLFRQLDNGQCHLLVLVMSNGEFNINQTLAMARKNKPHLPILVISGSKNVEDAVNAFHLGATDYLTLPVDRLTFMEKVRQSFVDRSDGPQGETGQNLVSDNQLSDELIFGTSSEMIAFKEIILKVKNTDLPVLITGESGTGKEILADYLWNGSSRSNMPFVKVNCAAIPSELLESELFGYEKGAFTGAYRRKPGKFEAANGGILFLDEVSDLPFPLQSKLLHVLQDGKFSTLGSTGEVGVDVRIIAATNRNLEEAVRTKSFRRDLYYRLNVVHLHVPPLRERPEQIRALVEHFIHKYAIQYKVETLILADGTWSALLDYSWPGNIRELENIIRRATVLGGERFITDELANSKLGNGSSSFKGNGSGTRIDEPGDPAENLEVQELEDNLSLKEIAKKASLEAERQAIEKALKLTRWNRKKAATILNINYKTLLTKIKETGLDNV